MKYTISALSRKTGLSIHTLRYYEKEGLLRYVERTESGRRVYGEASMGCLLGVLCMKQAGMTLPQIKAFMDVTIEGVATLPKRLEMMLSAREQLSKLKEAVDSLFETYPAGAVSVYLHMFQNQTETGWPELQAILDNDERVTIK